MFDKPDIWTYVISLKDGEIQEVKLVTYTQGEIYLKSKEDIELFISTFYEKKY